jgi:hypothetical protein
MPAPFDAYFTVMDESLLSIMGEACTFIPKEGGQRTVTAIVEQSGQFTDAARSVQSGESLNVLVMRDPAHADYGGIDAPELGDGMKREGGEDVFSYQGRKQEVSTTAWVLEFARNLPYELGGYRR